jgi:hypothetical protein
MNGGQPSITSNLSGWSLVKEKQPRLGDQSEPPCIFISFLALHFSGCYADSKYRITVRLLTPKALAIST